MLLFWHGHIHKTLQITPKLRIAINVGHTNCSPGPGTEPKTFLRKQIYIHNIIAFVVTTVIMFTATNDTPV